MTTVLAVHHAGGSARSFIPLRRSAPTGWSVTTFEVAGQGGRRREPRCVSIADAGAELAARLDADPPAVLLGVSMGAMIAVEAVRQSRRTGTPVTVLASVAPPSRYGSHADLRLADLDDTRLTAALERDGQVVAATLNSPWHDVFLGDLRANLAAAAAHRHHGPLPATPIQVWLGRGDALSGTEYVEEWRRCAVADLSVRLFDGGHLFPYDPGCQQDVWRALMSLAPAAPTR